MNLRGWLLFCAIAPLATAAQAQMYKCVDERGVTHYSDNPGTGCKGKAVDIRPIPPVSGKIQGSSPDVARDNADFNRRQIERERAEVKEAAARKAQKELCAVLRNDKGLLISGRRIIAGYSDKGERVYMDDETRSKRLAELNQQLRACP